MLNLVPARAPSAEAYPVDLMRRAEQTSSWRRSINVLEIDPLKWKIGALAVGNSRNIVAVGRRSHEDIERPWEAFVCVLPMDLHAFEVPLARQALHTAKVLSYLSVPLDV